MLQPRRYPILIGRALFLEPDAFAAMAQDDEPVVEAALLVTLIGVAAGAAQVVGGLLFSWAMPPAAALAAVIGRTADQLADAGLLTPARLLDQAWPISRFMFGYDGGWTVLLPLVWTPFLLLALWLAAGLLSFLVGRALGGKGTLSGVLGATGLVVAPHLLAVVALSGFAAANGLLIAVWGMLLLYRAVQVAHDVEWRPAATTTLIATLLIGVLGALAAGPASAWLVLQ